MRNSRDEVDKARTCGADEFCAYRLQCELRPIKARFGKLLEYGKRSDDPKASAFCRDLSKLW